MNRTSYILVAAVATLGLAGCSSAAQSASVSGSHQTPATAQAPAGGPGAGRFPGASGLVAAVTGTTAQVQGATQQTAVTWTSTTRFTRQVSAGASAVSVGECVQARPARAAGSQSGTPGGGSQSGSTGSIAAATVEIVPSVNGSCAFGGFGGSGGRPGGRPSGAPTTMPTQGAGAGAADQGRRAFVPVGEVTSVGSGQFTVAPMARPGAMAMAPFTVTYSSSTVFTRLASAASSAVKVGVCVSAQGRTDDTGALTATTIAVSSPVGGTCVNGFGGRGFGGRGPGGATATQTGAANA